MAACITLLVSGLLSGQAPDDFARRVIIESRILSEKRTLDITLPHGYDTSSERYPVLIVLDGEFEHEIAAAVARFYASSSMLPRTIVVGVRNTNRARDLTPAPVAGFRAPTEVGQAGGADKFIALLADELLPFLDRTYRTAPMRVLVGHSLGGLFALHAITRRPGLFTGYLVMEPATWWNDEYELRSARATLARPEARRARVMLVNAPPIGVDTAQWGGAKPMVRELATPPGDTHESMAAAGMLLGLRTMFADFRPSQWRPGTRPIAMLERYDSLAERVGYRVPIPLSAWERTIRMAILARHYDDAEHMIGRMDSLPGPGSADLVRDLRRMLTEERATPMPTGWIPLEIPPKRPGMRDAAGFLGKWELVASEGGDGKHEIVVRASGDTVIVHDRIQFPSGQWDEGDHQVIQVTADGILEWGLPWFRGIAALLVLKGQVQPDGTMLVTREPRGWVPRGPSGDMRRADVFRRVAP